MIGRPNPPPAPKTRIGVAEIVNAQSLQVRHARRTIVQGRLRSARGGALLLTRRRAACNDARRPTRSRTVQHSKRWRIQDNRLLAGSCCRAGNSTPAIKIHILPFEVKNFPEPGASEQQEGATLPLHRHRF